MADRTPTPAASTRASKLQAFSRSTTPYLLGAVFASVVMAWYFFVFVPGKLQYFVGLRFRTLAVASGQVKSKAENLARSLSGGVNAVGAPDTTPKTFAQLADTDLGKYLGTLVPEIRLDPGSSSDLQLTAAKGPATVAASVAWDDVLRPAAAASAQDFSDLILANASGQVVWQRDRTTPRIGNLKELLGAETQTRSWWSLSWQVQSTMPKTAKEELPDTAFLKPVDLGGVSSFLLVQSVLLRSASLANAPPEGARYFVAGLVPRGILQEQAMRIPLLWIVLVVLPVALLFLALPFVKLLTLTSKERYAFTDIVLLVVATICATGIGAMLFSGPASIDANADTTLQTFAGEIESRLAKETRDVLDLAAAIQTLPSGLPLKKCRVDVPTPNKPSLERCGLWEVLDHHNTTLAEDKRIPIGAIELDVVVWLDGNGDQQQKWTTKTQVTGAASHRSFNHFRDLVAEHTWNFPEGSARFTIDPLRTPTTSEMGVVFALPIDRSPVADARFLALNVRPRSVVDPVVPPGYGFAVIAPDGRVMFHSEEARSLEENFLEEVGNPEEVRENTQSGHKVTWSGDYHGRRHRLYLQPVTAFVGCPWRIVTFREMDPVFTSEIGQHSGVLRLGTLNVAFMAAFWLGFWFISHRKHRRASDHLLSAGSIRPLGVLALVGLSVIATRLILWSYSPESITHYDALYFFFALLPLGTTLLALRAREGIGTRRKPWPSALRTAAVLMLLFLIAAAPAMAFARFEHAVQDSRSVERWLEVAEERWAARYARAVDRAQGIWYADETTTLLKAGQGFAAVWRRTSATPGAAFSYLEVLTRVHVHSDPDVPVNTTPDRTTALAAGQGRLRTVLDWSVMGYRDTPGAWKVELALDKAQYRLRPDRSNLPTLSAAIPSGVGHDVTWRAGVGALILIGTFAALIWARRRLGAPHDPPPLDPRAQVAAVPTKGNEIVLLIGAPRTRKDQCARETVRSMTGKEPAIRVPLLDAELNEKFIERTVGEIDQFLARTGKTRLDDQGRLWIHVSNLEAQLSGRTSREFALRLLERLLERTEHHPPKALMVTTSVDPIANFAEVFHEERQGIYEDAIPEVELCRLSLLLSRFRRCYLPIGSSKAVDRWKQWMHYVPANWPAVLDAEIDGYEPLATIGPELKRAWRDSPPVPAKELARAVMTKAEATYELLWTSCTRSEKLVLIQLAQEGLINPKSRDVVERLMSKGFIVRTPQPMIFNYSFRMFLRRIERHQVVDEWERMEGSGLWVTAGRLIGSSMLAGGIFFLVTQDFSVQSLLPIISGTGLFGLPFVRDLMARFSGGSGGSARNA